jgi:hypothetical protein
MLAVFTFNVNRAIKHVMPIQFYCSLTFTVAESTTELHVTAVEVEFLFQLQMKATHIQGHFAGSSTTPKNLIL